MVEPAPDTSDYEMETIREGWPYPRSHPRPELPPDMSGFEMTTIREGSPVKRSKPRRAQETGVSSKLLITLCFLVGLIGAFIGNVIASFL